MLSKVRGEEIRGKRERRKVKGERGKKGKRGLKEEANEEKVKEGGMGMWCGTCEA